MRVARVVPLLACAMALFAAASPTADVKREQRYSDRLRMAQREYLQILNPINSARSANSRTI